MRYEDITSGMCDRIVEMYDTGAGCSLREISETVGPSQAQVNKVLRQRGVHVLNGPERRAIGEPTKDRIVELYGTGMSQMAVSRQVGCCKRTVALVLRERGVEARPFVLRQRIPVATRSQIVALYDAGMPIAEIARRVGHSHSGVGKILDEDYPAILDKREYEARLARLELAAGPLRNLPIVSGS